MNKPLAWPMIPRLISIVATAAVVLTAGPAVRAQDEAGPLPVQVAAVLDRLAADPLTPPSYAAAVTLRVKLRMFPFISLTLNGNSTYERPGQYKFSFHGFPLVARQFEKMDFNLGDPKVWPEKYDVALQPCAADGDTVLRLTPKSSKIVRYIQLEVDPQKGHINRAQWSRYDNGTLALTQRFKTVGSNEMVSEAQVQVAIGAIKANLNIDFANFVIREQTVASN
ncbi:MAG TPA: hypothetical protein VN905_12240 [Candidatus Binatia bacterium]|nr:hypothetical protein [Candidatus Binatia bacterium]